MVEGRETPQVAEEKKSDTLAIVALVLGVISVMFVFGKAINYEMPLGLGAGAIVTGIIARRRRVATKMATWGIALGILGVLIGIAGYMQIQDALSGFEDL